MAAMRLFGRRCALATDDFFFIGIVEFVVFLPWLAWIPVIYASYLQERNNCEHLSSLSLTDVSFPFLCVLFFANWIIACLFFIFSIKGSISKPEPRRHVVTLVYMKLFISVLDGACAILGTVIIVNYIICDVIGVLLIIRVATIFQWVATVFRIGMIILFYDWNNSKNTKATIQKKYFVDPIRKGTLKRWNLRLQAMFLWCTTASEARKEALRTASELLALMSCDLDLVASDIIAGLLLYRQKCLCKWEHKEIAINAMPPIMHSDGTLLNHFPPENVPDWMNLNLAKHYFNLSLGVFGWPWYIYRNITCGCCHIMKRLTCCFCCRQISLKVLGDNCCGCNLAGLQATTSLPYDDLVHVNFIDKVFEVPFFIAYDHETKSVLITVRGTMSLDDVLTDVSASYSVMDDPGCPPNALCHQGILCAAREIKKKLEEKELLLKAFEEHSDYKLVVTGHSLGASVSSILTLLLKVSYPNIRCYAFSPPPTVNKSTLPFTISNIFTINYGNDSVPYLDYENIKIAVTQMVKCLKECDLPKFKVFLNHKRYHTICNENDNECNKDENGTEYGIDNVTAVKDFESESETGIPCVTESLFVAGTILHIRMAKDGYRLSMTNAAEYKPLEFKPNMIFHHFPQNMQKCLEFLGKTSLIEAKSLFYSLK